MNGAELIVTFLGTGSAIPPEDRQQVSFTLRHPNGLVIFDCGEGTQYQLRKLRIPTRKELVICLSHLHSDHFLGLPGLLASFQLLGREEKITIIGPQGTKIVVNNLMVANFIRVEYEIEVVELSSEKGSRNYKGSGYIIKTFKAIHEANALSYIWLEDHVEGKILEVQLKKYNIPVGPEVGKLQRGESIEIDGQIIHPEDIIGPVRRGRCIIYSGDTAINEQIVDEVEYCDLLVHEATYPSDLEELAAERSHSTILQVAKLASKLQPIRLVMTHFSPRILNFEAELSIAKKYFENTVFAEQGKVIVIPYLYHK